MAQVVSFGNALLERGRPVYIPEEFREQPVSKKRVASEVGMCTRTVDRWVTRDGLPKYDPDTGEGCWIQAGAHRRFYVSRVRAWLDKAPNGVDHKGRRLNAAGVPIPKRMREIYGSN